MEQAEEARAQFVQKLIEQPALREEFRLDPEATAEAHGVGSKTVGVLQSIQWNDEELMTRLSKIAWQCCDCEY